MMVEGVEIVEEREPLDTHQMLMDGFFENLSGSNVDLPEMNGVEDQQVEAKRPIKSLDRKSEKSYNTEVVLSNLFDAYDEMVGLFSVVSHNSATSNNLSNTINKIGKCIRSLGGEVDDFSPLNHVSGLQPPNMLKNANKVLDNTKNCYVLGNVESADVDENGDTIEIVFSGSEGDIYYRAIGVIKASSGWNGNEAIDYVYTPGAGKLFVKSFESNKWYDRSNNYDISWDLEEYDKDQYIKDQQIKEKNLQSANEKKGKNIISENTSDNDLSVNFPIMEK